MKIKHSEKGVSSLEMVASVAIFSLISLVVLTVFFVNQIVWSDSLVSVRMQDQAKKPMQARLCPITTENKGYQSQLETERIAM